MTDGSQRVVAGVDAHTDEHHAAVLDESGRLLATAAFPATREGYERLIAWVAEYGVIDRIGVESTGSFAAELLRALAERAIETVEVNPAAYTHETPSRQERPDRCRARRPRRPERGRFRDPEADERHRRGDPAALGDQRERGQGAPRRPQPARTLVTAPDEIRAQLKRPKTLAGKATLCGTLRPDLRRLREPAQAAKLALRSLARRVRELDLEIAELDQLTQLTAPLSRARPACSASAACTRANC